MKCDCCHKEFDKVIDVENETGFDKGEFNYDFVCEDCAEEFKDWMNEKETKNYVARWRRIW